MATKFLNINSDKPTTLAQYSNSKIVVRKIEVIEGDVMDLFTPIKVTTNLPTGEQFQYYIHATPYFSNTQPGKETDIPMDLVIQYCQFTELLISVIDGKKLVFRLSYTIVEGEPVNIIVTQNLEGFTFSLPPTSKEIILSKFKDARPIRSVFVGYDVKQSFESLYGKIEKHIIPTLTDLNEEQIEQLGQIKLIDAVTNREIKSI